MHKLNARVKKLETVITGEPFHLPLLDSFTLGHFYAMMASYGINRHSKGQVALIDASGSRGFLGVIDYDPESLELFEAELKAYQSETVSHQSN